MISEILHALNFADIQGMPYKPHPSYVGGGDRCLRAMVYWRLGIERKFADREQSLKNEHAVLKELTFQVIREKSAYNLSFTNETFICGRIEFNGKGYPLESNIDGVLTDVLENKYLLQVELVTQKCFEDLLQGTICPVEKLIKCCLLMKGTGLTQCVLLFKNKNTSAYLEYQLVYDASGDMLDIVSTASSSGVMPSILQNHFPGLYRAGIEWFCKVEECAKTKQIPPVAYEPGSWQCSYCSFRNLCHQPHTHPEQNQNPVDWVSLVKPPIWSET